MTAKAQEFFLSQLQVLRPLHKFLCLWNHLIGRNVANYPMTLSSPFQVAQERHSGNEMKETMDCTKCGKHEAGMG